MATDLYYNADPMLAGPLAYGSGRGELLQERERELQKIEQYNQEIAQRAALQEQQLVYQAANAEAARDQQTSIAMLGMGNQQYMQGQDWQGRLALEGLNQQGQVNYMAAQGQANAMGAAAQAAGQMARDRQQAIQDRALQEADAIEQAILKKDLFTSDDQVEQAWQSFEQKYSQYGFHRGMRAELAAQQEFEQGELRRQKIEAALRDRDGNPLVPPEMAEFILGIPDPNDQVKALLEVHANHQKQLDTAAKAQVEQQKADSIANDREIDNQRAADEQAQRRAQFDQEQDQRMKVAQLELRQKKADAKMKGMGKYQDALLKWSTPKINEATGESTSKVGPEPKLSDFYDEAAWDDIDIGIEDNSSDQPSGGEPKLKPGESIVKNPAGKRAILHANGTVTRLD